jgi:hypothetical protein
MKIPIVSIMGMIARGLQTIVIIEIRSCANFHPVSKIVIIIIFSSIDKAIIDLN